MSVNVTSHPTYIFLMYVKILPWDFFLSLQASHIVLNKDYTAVSFCYCSKYSDLIGRYHYILEG